MSVSFIQMEVFILQSESKIPSLPTSFPLYLISLVSYYLVFVPLRQPIPALIPIMTMVNRAMSNLFLLTFCIIKFTL